MFLSQGETTEKESVFSHKMATKLLDLQLNQQTENLNKIRISYRLPVFFLYDESPQSDKF